MTRGYPRLGIDMVTVLSWGLATIDSVAFMMTSDNSQLDLDNKWLSLAGLCWEEAFLYRDLVTTDMWAFMMTIGSFPNKSDYT